MTRPTSASIVRARSAKVSAVIGSGRASSVAAGVVIGSSGDARRYSLARIERAEVVADEVLDRERHVVPIERRQRVVVEVAVDLLVGRQRAVVLALALLAALLGLAVAAGARHVGRVAGPAEPVERREHARQVAAEVGWAVRVRRSPRGAAGARPGPERLGVGATATDRSLPLPL